MKAFLVNNPAPIESNPLVLCEQPKPKPGVGEILVRVSCCGVCRTDLHVIEGDLPRRKSPIIPGHQVVGVVEECGEEVNTFKVGDRVGVAWLHSTCGECEFCAEQAENLCKRSVYTGYDRDGGYAQYVSAQADYCYAIPEGYSEQHAAPLLCAGIIGYRALKRSAVRPRQRLAIFGFGSSAHITMQIAQAWGVEVFVATRDEKHRRFAKKMGAAWVGATFETLPTLVHGAIVFAPAGEIVPAALRALRPGGTVALAGIHMSDVPVMRYEECLFHEKNLCSVEANTRQDGRELFELAKVYDIKPEVVEFQFAEANQALRQLKSDGFIGTAVLKW
ncbi:MAG: zinc-dependent alcohol dehydrogenase family protein [Oligoflexia bacterium]|nr:zinc-dependent alcohol dehydrogenase family protein [Oligoflexia bacterium]